MCMFNLYGAETEIKKVYLCHRLLDPFSKSVPPLPVQILSSIPFTAYPFTVFCQTFSTSVLHAVFIFQPSAPCQIHDVALVPKWLVTPVLPDRKC